MIDHTECLSQNMLAIFSQLSEYLHYVISLMLSIVLSYMFDVSLFSGM